MSTAIFMMDMPKSCWECRFQVLSDLYSLEEEPVCEVECRTLKESAMKNKPKWCPLMSLSRETLYEVIYQAYDLGNDERYKKLRDTIEEVIYGE